MKIITRFSVFSRIFLALTFVSGCATQVVEKPSEVSRSEVPFGTYNKIILVKAAIAEPYAGQAPNIKAVNKVDEILATRMPGVLKNLEVKTAEQVAAMDFAGGKVLLIKPLVKQVKFIGGAARFWAGAMAGSSVIVMDATFEDAASGKVLSNPGFYRKAGAYADSFGVSSNRMLDDVAQDLVNYADANR